MKLAVSNIAWAPEDRAAAYAVLARHGITGLEVAPGLLFPDSADPFVPSAADEAAMRADLAGAGLALVSMQSLLFGVSGAALFEGPEALARFETGMIRAITLAGRLGIPNLVFGSPRQRIVPEAMTAGAARDHATAVMRRLGDAAAAAGTVIAMESNPADYGTNWLTRFDEAAAFVAHADHPAVTLILDMGAMHMNGQADALPDLLPPHAARLSHVHMSEPWLAPAPAEAARALPVFTALRACGYTGAVSIEMKATGPAALDDLDAAVARLTAAAARASGAAA